MKIFCIGRNYAAHARELRHEVPAEPLIFMKPKNALLQENAPFYYPEFTSDLHYECELVIRLCKNGKYIHPRYASRYYDEISVGIDFTARDVQQNLKKAGHPWEIAKAFDCSAVLGEMIPLSQIGDLSQTTFRLDKNGETVQKGCPSNMIFSIPKIVAYVSRFFTLNIGDLIYTGTPPGVGAVRIGDRLEGFLQEKKLFDLTVR